MSRTLLPMLLLLAACTAAPPDEAEPPASAQLVASASPTPRAERVRGWPSTRQNRAGLYSWNGMSCGMSCISGFMHNGYGGNDLEIRIAVVPEGATRDDGGRAVTVAGHDGVYRRIDALNEEWIVDIEGTTVGIALTAAPIADETDLAEAYAIIDSMRTEAADNDMGFRLIFRLTTDDWDSG